MMKLFLTLSVKVIADFLNSDFVLCIVIVKFVYTSYKSRTKFTHLVSLLFLVNVIFSRESPKIFWFCYVGK